jgi:hypothetical protein
LGTTILLLYLALTKSVQQNIWSRASLMALSVVSFGSWCNFATLDQDSQNELIFNTGYSLFYAPVASQANPKDDPVPAEVRPILPAQTKVKLKMDDNQEIEIITGKGLLRTYSWGGDKRSVTMKVVWHDGNSELNFPTDLSSYENRQQQAWFDWKIHDGTAKCCTLEERKNFASASKLNQWIREQNSLGNHRSYRDDGLMISCTKNCEPHTLWVEIYQLMIDGKKPTHINGSDNNAFIFRPW